MCINNFITTSSCRLQVCCTNCTASHIIHNFQVKRTLFVQSAIYLQRANLKRQISLPLSLLTFNYPHQNQKEAASWRRCNTSVLTSAKGTAETTNYVFYTSLSGVILRVQFPDCRHTLFGWTNFLRNGLTGLLCFAIQSKWRAQSSNTDKGIMLRFQISDFASDF